MQPINMSVATLAAASANANSADIPTDLVNALQLVIDITAISGAAATLTVTIQGKDDISGKYFTILASAGLTTTGTTVLRVGQGMAVTANASANDFLPRVWRVSYTITGTSPSVTATIAANLFPASPR